VIDMVLRRHHQSLWLLAVKSVSSSLKVLVAAIHGAYTPLEMGCRHPFAYLKECRDLVQGTDHLPYTADSTIHAPAEA
jgi:hypothetical protein